MGQTLLQQLQQQQLLEHNNNSGDERVPSSRNGNGMAANGKLKKGKTTTDGQHQQQKLFLPDENGGQQQSNGSANKTPIPVQRIWRPAGRPSVASDGAAAVASRLWAPKRRKRLLLRLAALLGTLTLAVGLLLVLWLLLWVSRSKPAGRTDEPMTKTTAKATMAIELESADSGDRVANSSSFNFSLPADSVSSTTTFISTTVSQTTKSFLPQQIQTLIPVHSPKTSSSSTVPSMHIFLPKTFTQSSPHQQPRLRLSLMHTASSSRRPPFLSRKLATGQHRHQIIRVTAPAHIEFDRMEAPTGRPVEKPQQPVLWAQLDKGGQSGQLALAEKGESEGTKGNQTVITRLTSPNHFAAAVNFETTTTISKASTNGLSREEKNDRNTENDQIKQNEEEKDEQENDEDEDLYWMLNNRPRAPPATTQQREEHNMAETEADKGTVRPNTIEVPIILATLAPMTTTTTELPDPATTTDGYEARRPTIEFGPVWPEDDEDQKMKTEMPEGKKNIKPNNNNNSTHRRNGDGENNSAEQQARLQEELNEIIASVEREPAVDQRRPATPRVSASNPSPYATSSFEIKPVEIPFEPADLSPPLPVWRRPPPDEESAEWPAMAMPPTPPPPPSSSVNSKSSFSLQARVQTSRRPDNTKTLVKERQALRRKRREAPVLVTALLDIGRGEWERFTRHFDQYLGYLTNIVLRLQNNLVIFCDPSVVAYLRALGDQVDWERIQIVDITLPELPFYKYRSEIEAIMRWEQANWQREWDQQMRAHPETLYPDYDILVNSKPYFLYNATQSSRFPRPVGRSEQFFAWIDAGYGHGSKSAIPTGVWSPKLNAGQITLVKLPTQVERVERFTLDNVYRKQRAVISGGFLVGDERTIQRFRTFFTKTFIDLLDQRKVDDDQTTLLVTIQRYNSTFNLLKGNWFDGFKLLSSTSPTSVPS